MVHKPEKGERSKYMKIHHRGIHIIQNLVLENLYQKGSKIQKSAQLKAQRSVQIKIKALLGLKSVLFRYIKYK